MKKILLVLLSLVAMLSACVAPPAAAPAQAPAAAPAAALVLVAGITQNTVDPFWVSVDCGAQAEAAKRGVELKLFTSTSMDANELTSLSDAAKLAQPAGMFWCPLTIAL